MSVHSDARESMYEYLRGELPPADEERIRVHVGSCKECSNRFAELEEILGAMSVSRQRPSDARSDLYWQHFSEKVERRIEAESGRRMESSFVSRLLDALLEHKKPFGVGFASALSLVALAFAAWSLWFNPASTNVAHEEVPGLRPQTGPLMNVERTSLERRADDYLERSKVLLIGLINADPGEMTDSSPLMKRQREVSRSLLHESTELSSALNDPSQRQLKELVSDLGLILMQIANLESDHAVQGVQIVRSGVEQNGILFKINLEEIQRATHRGSQRNAPDKSGKPST
jgi:hypothetical protein